MLTAYISVFCVLAMLSGLWVAIAKHPITGAVGLVAMMISLAGLYGLLAGPFLGIVQITVYAGAIMMLIIFVIMVVGGAMDHDRPKAGVMGVLGGIGALTFFGLIARVLSLSDIAPHQVGISGTVEAIGLRMFDFSYGSGGWHVAFEITALVLLVALVGAVAMAKRDVGQADEVEETSATHVAAEEVAHA